MKKSILIALFILGTVLTVSAQEKSAAKAHTTLQENTATKDANAIGSFLGLEATKIAEVENYLSYKTTILKEVADLSDERKAVIKDILNYKLNKLFTADQLNELESNKVLNNKVINQ